MDAGQRANRKWCCLPRELATRRTDHGRFIALEGKDTGELSLTEEQTGVLPDET